MAIRGAIMLTRGKANRIIKYYDLPVEVTYVRHYHPTDLDLIKFKYKDISFYMLMEITVGLCLIYEDLRRTDTVICFDREFRDASNNSTAIFQKMIEYWKETNKVSAIAFAIKNKKELIKTGFKALDFI